MVDADYSLNDLFETDWDNETKTIENNVSDKDNTRVSQGESSSRVTEHPDPDYSLDDCFDVEWSADLKKEKKMTYSPESVIEIMKYKPISKFIELFVFGYELNVLNEKGQTPLHLLFYQKGWECFAEFDKHLSSYPIEKHNKNFTDFQGLTHLHIACAKGSLSLVCRYLYNNENIIDAAYKGDSHTDFTALHFAMINQKNDRKKIVKKLIEHGANVNAVDVKGRTPFHIVSRIFEREDGFDAETSIEIMEILLEIQNKIDAKDKDGNTPSLSVFSQDYREFHMDYSGADDSIHDSVYMPEVKEKLKFFLRHGADVTATNNKNENVLHLVLDNLMVYRYQFQKSNHIFDDSDHLDMIKQIFNANANIDINLKTNDGEIPLQMAVACMSPKIVELLLDHGVDLNDLKFEFKGDRRGFFCYLNIVAIFEPVQDLIDVLDLLSSRGFNMSLRDNIEVVKFFSHEDDGYSYPFCDCENHPYTSIKFVLYYGSKSHTENVLERLYHDFDLYEGPGEAHWIDVYNDARLKGTQELYSDLMEYLDTIRLGNVHSDEDIKKMIMDLNDHILARRFESTYGNQNYIEKDLNSLKNIRFENNISLHDVLKKDPLDTPHSIANDFDLKLIENLHCFKDAVKGHITKSRVRCFFEKYSGDYLKLIDGAIPDICCRMIVYYLSNDDILNLCLATAE